jgi:glycosyltransferase involved in cell wall biosynthesis
LPWSAIIARGKELFILKILALCDYYSRDSIGGAERVAREVYERLAENDDCEILVVSGMSRGQLTAQAAPGPSRVQVVHVSGIDLSKIFGAQLLYIPKLRSTLRRHISEFQPDVIHANGLHFHGSFIGASEAKRSKIPLVSTAHLADVDALPFVSRTAAKIFNRLIARSIARASDIVVAVSSSVRDHLRSMGISQDRIRVVLNGVDHRRFQPSTPRVDHNTMQAILVGRLIANKGSLDALEGISMARQRGADVRLLVLGDGPLSEKVKSRSEMSDLKGAVELVGTVTNVEDYLRRVDVLLRPSWTEGLPLAIIEALACGTPVICTDVPGNTDLIEDGVNGLVFPVRDTQALSDQLLKMSNDHSLQRALSAGALSSSRSYTWEKCADGHYRAFVDAAQLNG